MRDSKTLSLEFLQLLREMPSDFADKANALCLEAFALQDYQTAKTITQIAAEAVILDAERKAGASSRQR